MRLDPDLSLSLSLSLSLFCSADVAKIDVHHLRPKLGRKQLSVRGTVVRYFAEGIGRSVFLLFGESCWASPAVDQFNAE